MDKKIIVLIVSIVALIAGLFAYFSNNNNNNSKDNQQIQNNNIKNNSNSQELNKEVTKNTPETKKEVKKYALGEYGEFKDFIKKDLSDEDKKILQMILNEREQVKARYEALIARAKLTPNADKNDLVKKTLDKYLKEISEFDKKIRPFMIKEKIDEYNNTIKQAEIKQIKEKVYKK